MSNEQQALQSTRPTLVAYSPKVDLVQVRLNPGKYPRICSTPHEEAVKRMVPIVYAAFLYRGQEADSNRIRFIAAALVDEIVADPHFGLGNLSWFEIGMVIRRAVLGGSKELYGVCVSSLYTALIDYVKTEGAEADKKAFQRKREENEFTPF